MGDVTNMSEYREARGLTGDIGTDFLTDLLTDPAKRKKAAWTLGVAAAAGAGIAFMLQPDTKVISTTGSEIKDNQIVSVTAQNQLAQAIKDAADKAPADKLKALQNGSNLVTVQEAVVGSDGKPLGNRVINPDTQQYEPVVEITNTTSRLETLFTPDKIGTLGVQALPVDPATGQPS